MNALRVARAALRARPAAMRVPVQRLQRRSYADAATDKARILRLLKYLQVTLLTLVIAQIKLNLSLPHEVRWPPTMPERP